MEEAKIEGMISITLQTQEKKNITTINNFLRQAEGTSRRNHKQEINRESTDGGSKNENV